MRMKLTMIATRPNLLICDIYVSAWLKLQILLHNIFSCFDRTFLTQKYLNTNILIFIILKILFENAGQCYHVEIDDIGSHHFAWCENLSLELISLLHIKMCL